MQGKREGGQGRARWFEDEGAEVQDEQYCECRNVEAEAVVGRRRERRAQAQVVVDRCGFALSLLPSRFSSRAPS